MDGHEGEITAHPCCQEESTSDSCKLEYYLHGFVMSIEMTLTMYTGSDTSLVLYAVLGIQICKTKVLIHLNFVV